jgi:hypothetical protein
MTFHSLVDCLRRRIERSNTAVLAAHTYRCTQLHFAFKHARYGGMIIACAAIRFVHAHI